MYICTICCTKPLQIFMMMFAAVDSCDGFSHYLPHGMVKMLHKVLLCGSRLAL